MRIHGYGEKNAPVIMMLPGPFCNADTMANIISKPFSGKFQIAVPVLLKPGGVQGQHVAGNIVLPHLAGDGAPRDDDENRKD